MKMIVSRWVATTLLLASLPVMAAAQEKRLVCVFDIIGKAGDQFNIMTDFKTAALKQGYQLTLKAYTNERIAAKDLSANQCDAAALTGVRAKKFNKYTGSIDSIGSIPSYKAMRMVIRVLSSNNPSVVDHMTANGYEVMGVMPMGAAYAFVNDRKINTVGELAGKSIAVMKYDMSQARMVRRVGASPKLSDITNFAGLFNNGVVDISFAPLAAYEPMELYKGMRPNGGILDYVLGQLSMQLVGHKGRFSPEFAAWARTWFADQGYERAMQLINNARESVPEKWWIRIPEKEDRRIDAMMKEARIAMTRDSVGLFDKDMMTLLRKIRCKVEPGRAECSMSKELWQ